MAAAKQQIAALHDRVIQLQHTGDLKAKDSGGLSERRKRRRRKRRRRRGAGEGGRN